MLFSRRGRYDRPSQREYIFVITATGRLCDRECRLASDESGSLLVGGEAAGRSGRVRSLWDSRKLTSLREWWCQGYLGSGCTGLQVRLGLDSGLVRFWGVCQSLGDVPRLNSPFFSRRFPPCLTGSLAIPHFQPSLCHSTSLSNIYVHTRGTRTRARRWERKRVCAAEALSSSLLLLVLSAPVHPREDQYEPVVIVPILSLCVRRLFPEKISEMGRERAGRF